MSEVQLAAARQLWAVQLGAFREASRAEALRGRLDNDGVSVRVRTDGVWHRVQTGSFGSRAEAESARARLRRLGWTAVVVRLPLPPDRVAAGG